MLLWHYVYNGLKRSLEIGDAAFIEKYRYFISLLGYVEFYFLFICIFCSIAKLAIITL